MVDGQSQLRIDLAASLQDIDIDAEALTLVLVSGGGRDRYQAWKVLVAGDVERELRDICSQALARLPSLEPYAYDPDSEVMDGECFLVAFHDLLDSTLIEAISPGPSLEAIDAGDLRARYFCYAIVFGPGDDPRAIFIKKTNPVKIRTRSFNWVSAVFSGNHALQKIKTPEIQFHNDLDAVILPNDKLVTWDRRAFESLFKHEELVKSHAGTWVQGALNPISDLVSFDGTQLIEQAQNNSIVRNKWHALHRQPPLTDEHIQKIRTKISELPADARLQVQGGRVVVTPENVGDFFGLINEDDYVGAITGTPYRAQHKRRRPT